MLWLIFLSLKASKTTKDSLYYLWLRFVWLRFIYRIVMVWLTFFVLDAAEIKQVAQPCRGPVLVSSLGDGGDSAAGIAEERFPAALLLGSRCSDGRYRAVLMAGVRSCRAPGFSREQNNIECAVCFQHSAGMRKQLGCTTNDLTINSDKVKAHNFSG